MAKRFDSMYDLPGSLEDQLEEVSRFVQELTLVKPTSKAPPIPQRNPARSPTTEVSDPLSTALIPLSPPAMLPQPADTKETPSYTNQRRKPAAPSSSTPTSEEASPSPTIEPATTPPTTTKKHVSEFSFGGSSTRDSASSYASSTSSARSRGSSNSRYALMSVAESLPLSWTPDVSEAMRPNTSSSTLLPPPAMRPVSAHSAPDISRVNSNLTLSPTAARQDSIAELHRSSTTASQKAAFEKEAFRNSAILCDV